MAHATTRPPSISTCSVPTPPCLVLDPPEREGLLADIGAAIDARGGSFRMHFVTPAVSGAGVMTDGIVRGEDGVRRCYWADSAPEYRAYHDREWGFPVADDVRLFEKLSLEGFQAGLSWLTILRKRENFRRAFAGFDFNAVARFGERDVTRCSATRRSSATAARSRR